MLWFILLILFAVDAVLNIIFSIKHNRKGELITKPLLMPLLILFAISFNPFVSKWILIALFFGFLGDVFLLFNGKFFALGLAAFLIGHVFYIIAFLTAASPFRCSFWFILLAIPYLIYGYILYRKLLPNLHEMKIPALLYLLFILAMSYTSLTLLFSHGALMLLPVIGSLLFIASDSILALCAFGAGAKKAEWLVMPTYIAAQFLITLGFIL